MRPLADAYVGGLAVATALTLVVVPVMYSGMDSVGRALGRLFGRRPTAAPSADAALQPSASARQTDQPQPQPTRG